MDSTTRADPTKSSSAYEMVPISEESAADSSPAAAKKQRLPPTVKAWTVLLTHGAACLALALSMAFGLDGYAAGD